MIIRLLIALVAAAVCSLPAFSQGSVRRYDTIAQMLAVNPLSVAVNGKLTAEVLGKLEAGDWGESRTVEWLASSSLDEEDGFVYDSPFTGQWVFPDRKSPVLNRAWFDVPTLEDHTQEIRTILSKTNNSSIQLVTQPTIQLGEPFKLWSVTNHNYERTRIDFDSIMFGGGTNQVDAGIERTGVGQITIRTNVIVDGMINLGDEWKGNWTPFWLNVKDYGAVGDGSHDDTAAIQSAIDSAGALYVVYFPPGNYRTTSRIDLNDGTRIRGDGWNTVIKADHNGHGFSYAGLPGGLPRAYYIHMQGLRLTTGSGKSPQNALNLIDVSDSVFIDINLSYGSGNGWLKGVYTYGNYDISDTNNVVAGGNWRNSFQKCRLYVRGGPGSWAFYGDGGPSSAGGPNDTVLFDSYFNGLGGSTDPSEGLVFARNCNRFTITHSGFEGYATNGVRIGTGSQSFTIAFNRFEEQVAGRNIIRADEWTPDGHLILGNMMLLQGGPGSLTRIYPIDFPGNILDNSYGGAQQIMGPGLLVGAHPTHASMTYLPLGTSKLILGGNSSSDTNVLVIGSFDGTNNPRASIVQLSTQSGTNRTNHLTFTSAASTGASEMELATGTKTNVHLASHGTGIGWKPELGAELSVGGRITAGQRQILASNFTMPTNSMLIVGDGGDVDTAFVAMNYDGGTNSRVWIGVKSLRSRIQSSGSAGGSFPVDVYSGNTLVSTFDNPGLEIPVGKGISLNGVYRTTWPTDASDIVGLSEWIDDRIGTTIVGGTNISVSYNDAGDTLTISYTGSGGGGGGGTNTLSVDGAVVPTPNLQDGDIQFTATGSNITATVNTSAVTYAKIQNVTAERVLGRQSGSSGAPQELTAGDGLVISGTDLKLDVAAGSNVSLATNGSGTITFNVSVPAGTNGWQIGVDGSIVASPNLADSTGIQVGASGTNITYALSDRDWGDISSSGSGLTFSIDSGAVTYAKMQNISAPSLLLGRGSASGGSPQEITIGTGLAMSGTTLSATGTNTPSLIVNGSTVAGGNIKDSTDLSFTIQSTTNVAGSINAGAVTFNKIQNISQNQILGRYSSGSGEVQGITLGPAFNALSGTLGITNSDKGDITTSSNGTSWVIDSAAVTYGKIQDTTSTNVVLGFGAGASPGDVKELSVGTGLITTPTAIQLNVEAGTNVVLTTNGTKVAINYANRISHDAVANLLLVTTTEVTDSNTDSTWRDVTPAARSGMSATIPAGTLISGTVLKIEMSGEIDTAGTADFEPELRAIFDGPTGSDYTITWKMTEPGSADPFNGTTWTAEAWIVIQSSGSPATIKQRSRALYDDGDTQVFSGTAGYAIATKGVASNSLDTEVDNTFKLEYRGVSANMNSFKVTSVVIWSL